ncbi:MAG: NAD-dependent epimerase/dehydratase family protein [Porticoccaceae bacterium]|nr:NAD-dependent epimerase/dehydratase family protein [Porticoccaceae bacterium]
MNVAITGANGFVGQALCSYLQQHKLNVTPITRTPCVIDGKPSTTISDFKNPQQTLDLLQQHDVLVHLAARTHHTNENGSECLALYRETNVENTLAVAEAAVRAGIKRFIFLSSIKVNGNQTCGEPFTVDSPENPEDAYGQSKYEAELALQTFCVDARMELTIIRPPLIYGERVKGNLAVLEKAIKYRIPLPLGSIHNKRDLLALPNLCDLIYVCLTHPKASGETFLAADGHALSTPQLIKLIAQGVGRKPMLLPFPTLGLKLIGKLGPQAQIERLTGDLEIDIEHTCKTLDWVPPFSPEHMFS